MGSKNHSKMRSSFSVHTFIKYLAIAIVLAILSSGSLIAGMEDVYGLIGNRIFLPLIPMTLLLTAAVVINDHILFRHLLLKNHLCAYTLCALTMAFVLGLLSIGIEFTLRNHFGLPHRIKDYSSYWILIDSFCNSILIAVIFFGIGTLQLFNLWTLQVKEEKTLTQKLKAYIAAVKDRLNPEYIFNTLKGISSDRNSDSEEILAQIRNLSAYLRMQLYDLPEPPKIETRATADMSHPKLAKIITSRKYRYLRHLIFTAILVVISCGTFFNSPDLPEFSSERLIGQLSMFAVLAIVAYVNILWLFPRFMRHGNVRRYALSVGIFIMILVSPIIAVQILTYEPNVYSSSLPHALMLLSTMGTMLTLFLFIGGISTALLLQNWISTIQRLTLLRAETVRQEYSYLRKQINPHFLFNILNNIGISVYDDPDYARSLIGHLISLLKYQLTDMEHETTTLEKELHFIKSYFSLEASRREKFDYVLAADTPCLDIAVPSLLFIPIIENGVKYSIGNKTPIPDISIEFTVSDDRLTLVCVNPYDAADIENHKGGKIGLANTRRRLELLYDDNYRLDCAKGNKTYTVKLEIPLT